MLFFAISALPETINLITKEAPGISGLKFDYNQIKICCRRA